MAVSKAPNGGLSQQSLKTDSHPANQHFALGRARKLRVLSEEQLALFWENGCAPSAALLSRLASALAAFPPTANLSDLPLWIESHLC